MPLQLAFDRSAETGDTYPSAYWRVDGIHYDARGAGADGAAIQITIGVYKDAAAAAGGLFPVASRSFVVTGAAVATVLGGAPISRIETWLAGRPQFTGATIV